MNENAGLYAQIIGSCWNDLDEAVRWLHQTDAAVGTFRVRRGTNRLTRLMATLAGMPAATEGVEMKLVVVSSPKGEEWRRSFGGHPLVSSQWSHADGSLAERMGPTVIRMQLEAINGALHYRTRHTKLLGIPIPRRLAPRVTASETPTGQPKRVAVFVEVRLPLLGRLIGYEGIVSQAESENTA